VGSEMCIRDSTSGVAQICHLSSKTALEREIQDIPRIACRDRKSKDLKMISGPQAVTFVGYRIAVRSIIKFYFSACSGLNCAGFAQGSPHSHALKFHIGKPSAPFSGACSEANPEVLPAKLTFGPIPAIG